MWAFGDCFACKDFIAKKIGRSGSLIIFVGELGAGEGTGGMYPYLMEHPNLINVCKEKYARFFDVLGVPSAREVYVFKII